MTALTRGPLPARVYWTRRLVLLGTAVLLVLGFARVLTGGSDASSPPEQQAIQVGATPTTLPAVPMTTETRTRKPTKKKTSKEPVLAEPEGDCSDEDIAVTPDVKSPVAGSQVLLVVGLRTIESAACTWHVSPETLTLKITSGKDDIWSSRQCPRAIRVQDVVVRQAVTTKVGIHWSGRRSDDECSRLTQWALPGWYHVVAAALAGEPSDLQFELEAPRRPVVTETVQPDPDQHKNSNKDDNKNKDDLKHR